MKTRKRAGKAKCCDKVLMAVFRRETLAELFRRHTGSYCIGTLDQLDIPAWHRGEEVAR